MAASMNSDPVSFNPSCASLKDDIELVERAFDFHDQQHPTNVNVAFNIDVKFGEERVFHLSVFTGAPSDLTEESDSNKVEDDTKDGRCMIDTDGVNFNDQGEFGSVGANGDPGEDTLDNLGAPI